MEPNTTPAYTAPAALVQLRAVSPDLADVMDSAFKEIETRSSGKETARDELIAKLERSVNDFASKKVVQNRKAALFGAEGSLGEFNELERQAYYSQALGNWARGVMLAGKGVHDGEHLGRIIGEHFKDERTAAQIRSMSVAILADGGNLVEKDYAKEFIDALYAKTVFMQAGPTVIPMPLGQITFHKQLTTLTGFYEAELANIRTQQVTTGTIVLNAKKLAVIVPTSKELINDTSGRVNTMISNSINLGLGRRMDRAAFRDTGALNTPIGIISGTNATNKVTLVASGATTVPALLEYMQGRYNDLDLMNISPAWIMSERVANKFMHYRNAQGVYLYREEMLAGRLVGMPWYRTSMMPNNLGAGTNESELILGDMDDVVMGETDRLGLQYSDEASYFDGTQLVSAYSTDQFLVKATARHDFALKRDTSFLVVQGQILTLN